MASMEITTRIGCKIACVYCPQKKLIEAYSQRSNIFQMTFDVFKKCLEKMPEEVNIDFGGFCEPWLNPEATEMVSFAHEKGHKVYIYTTLVGMKLQDIDLLESVNPNGFTLHLPSAGNDEHIEVDENYLNLLDRLLKSKIKFGAKFQGDNLDPKLEIFMKDRKVVDQSRPHTRASNVTIGKRPNPKRRRHRMICKHNLENNVLLPNGDVALCCMDYGLKHVLGNLLSSGYDSLFSGKEFLFVKEGLKDDSLDILCRYCEEYARHPLNKHLKKLKASMRRRIL